MFLTKCFVFKSFCKSQFLHKSVNLLFTSVIVKETSTDLWGCLQTDLKNTLSEMRVVQGFGTKARRRWGFASSMNMLRLRSENVTTDSNALNSLQATLHPAFYSLHPTPYTLHPTPYTLRPQFPTGNPSRLIDSCITQLKAQGPSRTCNESKEEGNPSFSPPRQTLPEAQNLAHLSRIYRTFRERRRAV